MATLRARHGVLVVDFRYHNIRCREKTNLTDTPANRKTLAKIIEKMEAEITPGIFDYGAYFPKSDKIEQMKQLDDRGKLASVVSRRLKISLKRGSMRNKWSGNLPTKKRYK